MKTYNLFVLILSFSAILFSCQNEMEEEKGSQPAKIKLVFSGGKSQFSPIYTRAPLLGWKNNDVVHLILDNGETADAKYSESDGFTLILYGIPSSSGTVTCRHFENGQTSNHQYYSFTGQSIEYALEKEPYTYKNNIMFVQGTLSPNCSRLRFKGESGQNVSVTGFSHLANYELAYDKIKKSTSKMTLSIGSDGYTDYVYGYPDECNNLSIAYKGKTYEKTISTKVLPIGSSGYIDLAEIDVKTDTVIHMEGVNKDEFSDNGSLDNESYTLTLSTDQINFNSSASSQTMSITTNDYWFASCSNSWLSVDKTIGSSDATLKISVEQNNSSSERQGVVYIKGIYSKKTLSITVTQAGVSYTLDASPTTVTLGSIQSFMSITVTSNDSWSVSKSATWINLSKTSGSNNGTFRIAAEANTGSKRTATVTIQGATSKKTVTINVTQAKASDIGRDDYPDDGPLD